jgi:cell division protein FtsW
MATSTADGVKNFTKKQMRRVAKAGFDWNMVLVLAFLLGFGLIMVYSASSYVALRDYGDQTHYFSRQAIADLVGIIGAVLLMFVPYRIYDKKWIFRWVFYGLATTLPLLTIPFGIESHHATRWVEIPGTPFNFQPAEASKLFMIMFMASWLYAIGKKINERKYFWFTLALPIPVCLIIYTVTDNLSSAIIIYAISFIMTFVVSRDLKRFIIVVGIIAVIVAIVIIVAENINVGDDKASFRLMRIYSWLHPENTADSKAHQIIQGLYAIGNGGVWGKGLGQSVQKISNLPEPHNDMIFAIICEELGVVGAIAVIIIFVLLLSRMYMIARDTSEVYPYMLVIGIMTHVALQVILNIAVATNSMPNTGVSLPFISYGGSSVCFLMAEMGIVLGINRSNRAEVSK